MLPPVDLQGGVPLSLVRAVTVWALLSAFGTLTFRSLVAPRAYAFMSPKAIAADRKRLLLLLRASVVTGLLAAGAWLVLQAGTMADADGPVQAVRAVPTVLARTAFGHVLLAQLAILAVLPAFVGLADGTWRRRAALGLATLALVLQAGHGHSYSMYGGPSLLLGADVLHLLGAGAWLGGLVPLLLLVRGAPPSAGATASRWFSPLGQWCIAALVGSAAFQGWILVGSIPGLVGTAYGWIILAKLALLAVLLGFAAANRYRFAPALLHGQPEAARRRLMRSILVQTGFAIVIVAVAAVLSGLPPAMHEQPTWSFASRFSLAAIDEDQDLRREVVQAALALSVGALLVAVALITRRFRLAACGIACGIAWFAVPHLDLLLVTAYPTSFYHSPTGFASASILAGRDVYAVHCVACHGVDGRGDGPAAKTLAVPPADLAAAHLWMHGDGELFWWLSHGIQTPEGAQAMPGFAATLDEDQRWAAIDFIRARNAGLALRDTGQWPTRLQAPGFDATCGRATLASTDLRGRFVRLRFGGPQDDSGAADVVTVLAGATRSAGAPDACVSRDESVDRAYAIVAGLDVAQLPGTEFLIDDQGWLRAMQRPGDAAAWHDPGTLESAIRSLRAHPPADTPATPMKMPM